MAIEYVRKKYGDELEFLWTKFPDNAAWRRKDNRKWYGVLSKEHYYPGWHTNKKSWYALVLDDCISDEEMQLRITESYELAKK